jgi:metallo-beta-lactamase family protein
VESQNELIDVIGRAYRDQGKVIIPAFAVERTQEIIYTLARAHEEGLMPADMTVYLDSPLAIQATEIFRRNPAFFDEDARALLDQGLTPFNLPNLVFTPSTEESRQINDAPGPAVIIAGSGMANAGRIKHHLKHNLWRRNCHVVIVGFQAKGTTGRKLVEGATKVKIFREDVAVKAQVHTIGGFSAHADQEELLTWLSGLARPGLQVMLIHGEESISLAFEKVARKRFPDLLFRTPKWRETLLLKPTGLRVPEDAEARLAGLRMRINLLEQRLAAGRPELDADALAALEDTVARAEAVVRENQP